MTGNVSGMAICVTFVLQKDDAECKSEPVASELKRLVMIGIRTCLEEGLMTAEDSSYYTHSGFLHMRIVNFIL